MTMASVFVVETDGRIKQLDLSRNRRLVRTKTQSPSLLLDPARKPWQQFDKVVSVGEAARQLMRQFVDRMIAAPSALLHDPGRPGICRLRS